MRSKGNYAPREGFVSFKAAVEQTFNVIAADVNTAKLIACKIAQGSIPDLYATPGAALAAWRAYPLPMHARYHPWAVSLRGPS